MADLQTEQPQEEMQRPRRRRREPPKPQFPLPAFLLNIGQDVRWYYDVRLWSPLILLLLILLILLLFLILLILLLLLKQG